MRNGAPQHKISFHPNLIHHQAIQTAIESQNKIGWDHFIRGRISKKWKKAQKLYSKNTNNTKWPTLCIKSIREASQKIWEVRNLLKFGTDSQIKTNHQKRLQPIIREYYYNFRQTVPRTQHKLFSVPLEVRYTFSPQENRQWINSVKLARKIYKRQEKEFYKTNHTIRKYFHPIQKPHDLKTKIPTQQKPHEINITVETQKHKHQTTMEKYITKKITVQARDAPT
jgi:hypothetical protein